MGLNEAVAMLMDESLTDHIEVPMTGSCTEAEMTSWLPALKCFTADVLMSTRGLSAACTLIDTEDVAERVLSNTVT